MIVLVQSYETQALAGSSVKGGVAVLRCAIPPAIKNDIQVTAWVQEFTGLTIYPSLQGGTSIYFLCPSLFLLFLVSYVGRHGTGRNKLPRHDIPSC